MSKQETGIALMLVAVVAATLGMLRHLDGDDWQRDHLRMTYSPLHFRPAIDTATDAQCLTCHREVLEDRVRTASPAGLRAADSRAWYQQVATYQGEQETFHRRHLVTPLAKHLMDLKCNTCHQGHDPRDEAPGTSATGLQAETDAVTLRKQVNPETTCLRCHGQMPWKNMGLPGPWTESGKFFGNSCTNACHERIRTVRHRVNYLKADAIEATGTKDGEVCYGCHGGRPWYRIAFPYPRHPWPEMDSSVPDWAKERPSETEDRFLIGITRTSKP